MDMITLAMAKAYSDSKGGYVEKQKSEVFPHTEITKWTKLGATGLFFHSFDTALDLNVGETYTIMWDGTKYECECATSDYGPALGNGKLDGYEFGSDEPFIIWDYGDGTFEVTATDNNSHTIAIYQGEIVRPIDPKYIPAMDSITLNGADGKQYKVTVNASGALTATAV